MIEIWIAYGTNNLTAQEVVYVNGSGGNSTYVGDYLGEDGRLKVYAKDVK